MKELFYTLFLSYKYFSSLAAIAQKINQYKIITTRTTTTELIIPLVLKCEESHSFGQAKTVGFQVKKALGPLLGTVQDARRSLDYPTDKNTTCFVSEHFTEKAVRFNFIASVFQILFYTPGQAISRVSFTVCLFGTFDTY